MSHLLYRMGHAAARRPWLAIGCWVLLTVAVVAGSGAFGRQLEDTMAVPGLDSQKAVDLLSSVDSDQAGLTAMVVVTPADAAETFFDGGAAAAELRTVHDAVASLPEVLSVSDPAAALAEGEEAAVAGGTVSPDGRVALVRVQYPVLEELDRAQLDELKELGTELGEAPAVTVELSGDLFFAFEEGETGTAELLGLLAAVVILLIAFGSVVAMGLPIGTALFGLALGISSMSLLTYLVEIPSWAPMMASMVGLGVGIDYALFIVSRHREHLAAGLEVPEAVGRSLATAGQAVVFAGGTVVVAILGLAVAGVPFVTAAGIAISVVVAIMVAASVTLLPAFLGLAGHRIVARRDRRSGRTSAPVVSERWTRWGDHVGRHAWPYAIVVTVVLLAVSAPVFALRLGFPDEGTLPDTRTERRAYDQVAEGFGPGTNGPLVIAMDIAADPTVVEPLVAAVEVDRGVAAVAPAQIDAEAGVATVVAIPRTAPQDAATFETVTRLRAEVFPEVLDNSAATAHIGGQTAAFADLGDRVSDRLPWFIAAVVGLSFVLLTMVFRSLLVPLKAAVLNLLSIGAAYGVLVMVFQWGWGASLIGLESTVPIVSFIPMFMFAILFGLSMDYEVFLLSRVREEYLATGDNDRSVVTGLAGTARVITSAALIMIAVFGGFVLGDDPVIKMLGLGLATAIAVDATVVRLILVPASMKLMGDANWWLPAWLDRLLPVIDMEGGAGQTDPVPAASTPVTTAPATEPVLQMTGSDATPK